LPQTSQRDISSPSARVTIAGSLGAHTLARRHALAGFIDEAIGTAFPAATLSGGEAPSYANSPVSPQQAGCTTYRSRPQQR